MQKITSPCIKTCIRQYTKYCIPCVSLYKNHHPSYLNHRINLIQKRFYARPGYRPLHPNKHKLEEIHARIQRHKELRAEEKEKIPLKPKVRELIITEPMRVTALAQAIGVRPQQILEYLPEGYPTEQIISIETIKSICSKFRVHAEIELPEVMELKPFKGKMRKDWPQRAPVVTIMGHVDHGKTTLLDYLRNTNVAAKEAGGITQHIGAFQVVHPEFDKPITFIDTPGHEAFTAMRKAGAQVTDIVILVVAADDGVMPQTIESIEHAQKAEVPIIVALNKMDKVGSHAVDMVAQQLYQHGLIVEEMGGTVPMVPISAKTGKNIENLIEEILIVSEVLELRAQQKGCLAEGVVIESKVDRGLGLSATVLVKRGILKPGMAVVAGMGYGKIKSLRDNHMKQMKEVLPAQAAELIGLSDMPKAGDYLFQVENEDTARRIVESKIRRQHIEQENKIAIENEEKYAIIAELKRKEMEKLKVETDAFVSKEDAKKREQEIEEQIKKRVEEEYLKLKGNELNVIFKADVKGTIEAFHDIISKWPNDLVKVKVIREGIGVITDADIDLAHLSNGIVIGMNIKPNQQAISAAKRWKIEIKLFKVIYHMIDYLKEELSKLLPETVTEYVVASAQVKEKFIIDLSGQKVEIAGCVVTQGPFHRRAKSYNVYRWNKLIFKDLRLKDLRHFKDSVREVKKGDECGIYLEGYTDIKKGDVIKAMDEERKRPSFDDILKQHQDKMYGKDQMYGEQMYGKYR